MLPHLHAPRERQRASSEISRDVMQVPAPSRISLLLGYRVEPKYVPTWGSSLTFHCCESGFVQVSQASALLQPRAAVD